MTNETNGQMSRFDSEVEEAMKRAAQNAIDEHRRLGLPLVEWRDGKIVWTPASAFQG